MGPDLSTVVAFFNLAPLRISPKRASLPFGIDRGGGGGRSRPGGGGGFFLKCISLGYLGLGQVSQTTDGRSDGGGSGSGHSVSATGNGLAAGLAVPDTSSGSSGGSLTAERTVVLGVLLHLQLLGLSSQGRTVSHTELTGDADLLSSLSPGLLVDVWVGWRQKRSNQWKSMDEGVVNTMFDIRNKSMTMSERRWTSWIWKLLRYFYRFVIISSCTIFESLFTLISLI